MNARAPNMAEVWRQAIEHRLSTLHVCMPGKVVTYDHTTQTATVQPMIKQVIVTTNGEEATDYPQIPSVPVAHPRAGSWFFHFPVSAGDFVVLHFAERSIDQFRLRGHVGTQDPLDVRKHHLADAIAVPVNLAPDASPLTVTSNTLSFGKQGGSTVHIKDDGTVNLGSETPLDAIATANKVATELTALKTALATDIATAVAAGGLFFGVATSALFAAWPGSVASSKGKVDP